MQQTAKCNMQTAICICNMQTAISKLHYAVPDSVPDSVSCSIPDWIFAPGIHTNLIFKFKCRYKVKIKVKANNNLQTANCKLQSAN